MAKTHKLVTVFTDSTGKTISLGFANSMESPTAANVKALMNAIIENGTIYKNVPVKKKDAYVVATDKTSVDVSD